MSISLHEYLQDFHKDAIEAAKRLGLAGGEAGLVLEVGERAIRNGAEVDDAMELMRFHHAEETEQRTTSAFFLEADGFYAAIGMFALFATHAYTHFSNDYKASLNRFNLHSTSTMF